VEAVNALLQLPRLRALEAFYNRRRLDPLPDRKGEASLLVRPAGRVYGALGAADLQARLGGVERLLVVRGSCEAWCAFVMLVLSCLYVYFMVGG
jgi:hypothetical protein